MSLTTTVSVEKGLSRSDTIHLFNEMKKIRQLISEDETKIKQQKNEIERLKKIISEKNKLLNTVSPAERLIASCMVTPIDFRNQIETKLLAIREEVLKFQTEKTRLVHEAPLLQSRLSNEESDYVDNTSLRVRRPSSARKQIKIYLDGCWDVMHSGHYNALRQAKALGDYLIVGVHSDSEIEKNKRKPIMNNSERLTMVKCCKWADEVVFDVPYSPSLELLDKVGADYCAHGDDMPTDSTGKSAYGEVESRLKIFKRTPGISTTALIHRLLKATKNNINKNNIIKNEQNNSSHSNSWTQFLPTSHRISAFSNHKVPNEDDIVVYIDGDWDLFHCGHVKVLEEAKKLGTFLFVGVYDDNLIRLQKGNCWPMMSLQERILNVLSCKYVDEIIVGSQWIISEAMIKSLNISKIVLSNHILLTNNNNNIKKRYEIGYKHNMIINLKLDKNILTTNQLVQRMINDHKYYETTNIDRIEKAKSYENEKEYVPEN